MYAHNDFFLFLIVTFVKTIGIPTSVQKGGGGSIWNFGQNMTLILKRKSKYFLEKKHDPFG
jgi:hypothetical protein